MHHAGNPGKLICIAAATLLLVSQAGYAEDDESYEAKYRQTVMAAMGSSFGAIAYIFTNRVDRPDQLQANADALAASASLTATLFPAGSEGGDALPLIWEEPEQLAEASQKAADATAALAAAAASGDKAAVAKAFKAAGETCKNCHERYKEEDD